MPDVAAIVLAAGRARRFGAGEGDSKVLAMLDGEVLVRRVIRAALVSRARPIVVVTGHAASEVRRVVEDLSVDIVHNAAFADGLASSLKRGLAALPPDVGGALVLLADMPCVAAQTIDALLSAFDRAASSVDAIVPCFDGRTGNPILIGRRMFEAVAALEGDAGARRLLGEPGRNVVRCEVEDPGIHRDVDTRDALLALQAGDRSGGA